CCSRPRVPPPRRATPDAPARTLVASPRPRVLKHLWRPLLGLLVTVGVLGALYLGASAYITDRATQATRRPIQGSPADLGLRYEALTFASAEDRIPSRGWYLPSRGERAIIVVHGLDQNRWNTWEDIPHKAQRFVQQGYDVLVFDLRGHGESGGER